jgi:hypothetical protein
VGYPVPPLAGLDKEKEKTHPYTTKGGAPAKATSKTRQRDPQRQLLRARGILRCAQDDAQKQKHSDKKLQQKQKRNAPAKNLRQKLKQKHKQRKAKATASA